jgi:carbon-monoxide dehydrogenase iron sulfur subunit
MKIVIDHHKCDGCKICEQICTFSHYQEFNPKRSRIKVVQDIREGISMPKTCNQCRECIEVCPEGAIYRNNDLGAVCLDEKKCTGCEICIQSCPQGVLSKDPISGFINICDFCGGEPQCVGWCPEKALQFQ